MIAVQGAFVSLRDIGNPAAQPLDPAGGAEALLEGLMARPSATVEEAKKVLLLDLAELVKNEVIEQAEAGMENEIPLAEATQERKGHAGWLHETGQFVRSWVPHLLTLTEGGYRGVALIPEGDHGRGLDNWQLMQILVRGAVIRISDPESVRKVAAWLSLNLPEVEPTEASQEARGEADEIVIVVPPRYLLPGYVAEHLAGLIKKAVTKYLGERLKITVKLLNSHPWSPVTPAEVAAALKDIRL